MKPWLDITCTATLRPELLKETLSTHVGHLFKNSAFRCRLIINVDMVGADPPAHKQKLTLVKNAAREWFDDVVMNVSGSPHFGRAFCWCMEKVEADFFFNLEEDWRMQKHISLLELIRVINTALVRPVAHLRLSAFPSGEDTLKNWNKFLYHNGVFFQVPEGLKGTIGWCGHPSLNRTSFMQECLPYIDPEGNPEKQIKGRRYSHPMNDILDKYSFGCFHPRNCGPAIVDIGREWMVKNKFAKAGTKAFFTQWEKEQQ